MKKFLTYIFIYTSLMLIIMLNFNFSALMNVAIFIISLAFIKGFLVGNVRELYNLYLLRNMSICKKFMVLELLYIYIILVVCMTIGDINNTLFISIDNIDIYINKFTFSLYVFIIVYRFLLMRIFEVVYEKLTVSNKEY